MTHAQAAADAVEQVARTSYGQLLAWLAWQWRDVSAAEDALSEALASALTHWPRDGVPRSPQAWLLTAARRQLLMARRRHRLAQDPAVTALLPDLETIQPETPDVPDTRLRLMFVCAHPAIDASVHAALMLQLVLGLDAARIASAWLVSPAALGKRLTRAKLKIRSAGIAFEEPEQRELPQRLASVLEAIYGLYAIQEAAATELRQGDLAQEALYLARLVSASMPQDPEAHGLCALLLLREAREGARRDADGVFVPLDAQDPQRWHPRMLEAAQAHLAAALHQGSTGPFQLEAAIQAAHMDGVLIGATPWQGIAGLYRQLLALGPTIGACIGHAVATAHAQNDAAAGLALLDAIDADRVRDHQPWWAARAHLLGLAGQAEAARQAYARAGALSADAGIRTWLQRQAAAL